MTNDDVVDVLEQIRKEKGIKCESLSSEAGFGYSYWHRTRLYAKNPQLDSLLRLMKVLEMDFGDLHERLRGE